MKVAVRMPTKHDPKECILKGYGKHDEGVLFTEDFDVGQPVEKRRGCICIPCIAKYHLYLCGVEPNMVLSDKKEDWEAELENRKTRDRK